MDQLDTDEEKPEVEFAPTLEFKKPVLIGRIGKLPRKVVITSNNPDESEPPKAPEPIETPVEVEEEIQPRRKSLDRLSPAELLKNQSPLPYKEPKWSGLPSAGIFSYYFLIYRDFFIV